MITNGSFTTISISFQFLFFLYFSIVKCWSIYVSVLSMYYMYYVLNKEYLYMVHINDSHYEYVPKHGMVIYGVSEYMQSRSLD